MSQQSANLLSNMALTELKDIIGNMPPNLQTVPLSEDFIEEYFTHEAGNNAFRQEVEALINNQLPHNVAAELKVTHGKLHFGLYGNYSCEVVLLKA